MEIRFLSFGMLIVKEKIVLKYNANKINFTLHVSFFVANFVAEDSVYQFTEKQH